MKTIIDSLELYNSFRKIAGQKPLTETEYKKRKEELEKTLKKDNEKIKYCGKKGHKYPEKILFIDGIRSYVICPECGKMYNRPLTIKESENWYRILITPMNI